MTFSSAKSVRDHHWDMLRAVLMVLGIPFHVFMSYRSGQPWIISSDEGAPIFNYLAEFIHIFRMPAFFIVSGYFAALILARRDAGAWLKGRMLRLGVPFVTCLLVLNPLMNMAAELSANTGAAVWQSFLYNSANSAGYWVRHLWFIIVLLYLSAGAALFIRLFPSAKQGQLADTTDAQLARNAVTSVVVAGVVIGLWEAWAVEFFYKAGLATNIPQQLLRIDELIQYAPWFCVGFILARAPRLRDRLYRPGPAALLLATGLTGLSLWGMNRFGPMEGRFVATLAAIFLAQAIMAACHKWGNRPNKAVTRLVEASFAIYLFHMPIILGLVLLAKGAVIPLALKVSVILMLTFALSYGAWAVIRRSAVLLFLFDGRLGAGDRQGPPLPMGNDRAAGQLIIRPSPALYRDRRCDPRPSLP